MVSIIADSTCDLSQELRERYDVSIMPLQVVLGDKEYQDGITITPDEIYKWSDENEKVPQTTAVTMESVINVCKEQLARADELVIFTISEGMSSCYNNCRLAVEELDARDRIRVIDSRNLSTGIGLLVIRAAIMAREGKTAEEIENAIRPRRDKIRASFVIDTLTYLYRGGRCSGLSAMAGGMLKLHPRISVVDGSMTPGKKYRGQPKKYVMDYVRDMENDLIQACRDRVFITHSGCPEEIIEDVHTYLESLDYFDEILITRAGSVISSHCGPGTLGVLFEEV